MKKQARKANRCCSADPAERVERLTRLTANVEVVRPFFDARLDNRWSELPVRSDAVEENATGGCERTERVLIFYVSFYDCHVQA